MPETTITLPDPFDPTGKTCVYIVRTQAETPAHHPLAYPCGRPATQMLPVMRPGAWFPYCDEHAPTDPQVERIAALEAEVARLRALLRHARIEANYWLALYDLADQNTATRSYYDALWEDEDHPFEAGDGWESGQPVPGVADA